MSWQYYIGKTALNNSIVSQWFYLMYNPPMCNIVPYVQHFFEEFVFYLGPLYATLNFIRNNFHSKTEKMVKNGLNLVSKILKLIS